MKFRVLILLVFVFLSGCEVLEEFNYVVVSVTGTVVVANYDFDNSNWGDAIDGEVVEMSLIKAGGERVDGTGTTGGGVGQTTIHGTFNLYKEQPIDFKAKLVSNPMVIGSDRVEWEYVNKNRRYGGKNQPDICSVDLYIPLKVPVN
jgi:hypothetical protein